MAEDIIGWPAVAWVAGLGGSVLLAASVAALRARAFQDRPREQATYRTAGNAGSNTSSELRGLAILMLVLFAVTQLLYVWVYVELAQWQLFWSGQPPRVSPHLFFWVCLVTITCVGATLHAAVTARD
jgi:hypothetical protein